MGFVSKKGRPKNNGLACTTKHKSFVGKKGFIGAIGDDLPSLIPLVVSLLLFFSIFSMTLNSYGTKNAAINKQSEMITAAREIKGDSLILDFEQFKSRCDLVKLKKYPYSFMIGIYDFKGDPAKTSSANITQDFVGSKVVGNQGSDNLFFGADAAGENQKYFCGYKRLGFPEFGTKTKNYLMRFYPVAIQIAVDNSTGGKDYYIEPGLMAMVVWE